MPVQEGIFLCIGCAKGLTGRFNKYVELVDQGWDREKALDEVGVLKLCCRNSSLLREKHGDKQKRVIPQEEQQMDNPFWCVGCQKNIGHLFDTYRERVKAGEDREAILKDIGVTDDCCIDTVKLAEQARAA
jgi:DNA-directed RNA polymerase subunit N (RpoN/RPB10)